MKIVLAIYALILFQLSAFAQQTFTINGTVKNQKDEKLQSATVFIAGSQKAIPTDINGEFKFKVNPGIYQVVVTMVGYNSLKGTVIIDKQDETLNFKLSESENILNEVVIGGKISKKRQSQIDMFTRTFIGPGPYSKDCKILNPELLKFTESDIELNALTTDFLIVENKALGYRIKYLLKFFWLGYKKLVYGYDGDYSFEALTGTAEEQATWENNRKLAYQGSLMHYLRSVYAGTARKEGFLVYEVIDYDKPVIDFKPTPVYPEQIIKRTSDQLAEFRFGDNHFYVLFDKQKSAQPDPVSNDKKKRLYHSESTGTVYRIYGKFDSKGSLQEYDAKSFYLQGFMTRRRVSDQLPYEYNPQ